MSSQDRYAQRMKETAKSGHSVGASYARTRSEQTQHPEHVDRLQVGEHSSRSEKFAELRRLGAVDFYGTTDPAEAGTWLRRTVRVLERMCRTPTRIPLTVAPSQVASTNFKNFCLIFNKIH